MGTRVSRVTVCKYLLNDHVKEELELTCMSLKDRKGLNDGRFKEEGI